MRRYVNKSGGYVYGGRYVQGMTEIVTERRQGCIYEIVRKTARKKKEKERGRCSCSSILVVTRSSLRMLVFRGGLRKRGKTDAVELSFEGLVLVQQLVDRP